MPRAAKGGWTIDALQVSIASVMYYFGELHSLWIVRKRRGCCCGKARTTGFSRSSVAELEGVNVVAINE